MKKIVLLFLAVAAGMSASYAQLNIGGRSINIQRAAQAASDLGTAIRLSDEDVAKLCRESVEWMDANNPVLPDDEEVYGARLKRLTQNLSNYMGLDLNFKVYRVIDVNAFASGDGSIRVFSSLMDVMTDDELLGVIGHEIGHIYNSDVKDAMKNAYLTSGIMNAAGVAGGTVAKLTDSQLGELATALTGAKFSQKQEYAADDFGFRFCVDNGINPYGMALSLEKLVQLFGSDDASKVEKMFSSHPDSEKRAVAVRQKADEWVRNNPR